jgi:hypothetical protein
MQTGLILFLLLAVVSTVGMAACLTMSAKQDEQSEAYFAAYQKEKGRLNNENDSDSQSKGRHWQNNDNG